MSIFKKNSTPNILLVGENTGEVLLTKAVFRDSKIKNTLEMVNNGEEAISYLKKEGRYADAVTPDLILLDINLADSGGRNVLSEIKNDGALRHIPVVLLTISNEDELDVFKSYSNHSNCHLTRPVDFNKFKEVIDLVMNFWFTVIKLPMPRFEVN